MGLLSLLFGGKGPTGPAPERSVRKKVIHAITPPSDYVVLDLETTGLDPCKYEIIEIGAIRVRNFKAVARYHTYIRPEGVIPASASAVNHITWKVLRNAPTLDQEIAHLLDFIGPDVIVGYNIRFDIKFLQTRAQMDLPNESFDIYSIVRDTVPDMPDYKLDTLRHTLHLGGTAHSSIGDCEATDRLYEVCRKSPWYERQLEEAAYVQAESARRAEIDRQHTELSKGLPSAKELHKISAQMQGEALDYLRAARDTIYDRRGVWVDLNLASNKLCYGTSDIMIAKTKGLLRYVGFAVPPVSVSTKGFVCAPATTSEFDDGTRVYLSRPDDLSEFEDMLLAAYDNAKRLAEEQQKKPPLGGATFYQQESNIRFILCPNRAHRRSICLYLK